jgi:pimeloyl-ACP methyl ester carboxylesterase
MVGIARGRVVFALVLGLLAVGLSCRETEAQQTALRATFARADCWFRHPEKYEVVCGYLAVPENRVLPSGRTIRLPVVIIPTTSVVPFADPVLFIGGGPGTPVGLDEEGMKAWWIRLDHSWSLQRHDLILFEQRGVGRAEPNLDCPEFQAVNIGILRTGADESKVRSLLEDAAIACRDRLLGEGHDLAGYTTAASAADIADLRTSLGIEQWTLFGISYGTRLALTVMRDYPEGIRSVILDSIYPPQVYGFQEGPLLVPRALKRLFARCAADEICSQDFPDIERRFRNLVARLDASLILLRASIRLRRSP